MDLLVDKLIYPKDFVNKIVQGDSRELLLSIPNESIDLVITSPPYKDIDGYSHDIMDDVFDEIYTVMKEDALFFLNFGHLAEDKSRAFRIVNRLVDDFGYVLNDTIVWVKNHYTPIQGKKRLNNLTEFIFLLHKGKMPNLNRLSIGIPYKDKSNVGRYADKDLKCGGNVWYIDYETITDSSQKLHNDRFPIELPERCIKLSGLKKGIVLDPFSGSGTTALAAKNLGLKYIGVEMSKKNCIISRERLGGTND